MKPSKEVKTKKSSHLSLNWRPNVSSLHRGQPSLLIWSSERNLEISTSSHNRRDALSTPIITEMIQIMKRRLQWARNIPVNPFSTEWPRKKSTQDRIEKTQGSLPGKNPWLSNHRAQPHPSSSTCHEKKLYSTIIHFKRVTKSTNKRRSCHEFQKRPQRSWHHRMWKKFCRELNIHWQSKPEEEDLQEGTELRGLQTTEGGNNSPTYHMSTREGKTSRLSTTWSSHRTRGGQRISEIL